MISSKQRRCLIAMLTLACHQSTYLSTSMLSLPLLAQYFLASLCMHLFLGARPVLEPIDIMDLYTLLGKSRFRTHPMRPFMTVLCMIGYLSLSKVLFFNPMMAVSAHAAYLYFQFLLHILPNQHRVPIMSATCFLQTQLQDCFTGSRDADCTPPHSLSEGRPPAQKKLTPPKPSAVFAPSETGPPTTRLAHLMHKFKNMPGSRRRTI